MKVQQRVWRTGVVALAAAACGLGITPLAADTGKLGGSWSGSGTVNLSNGKVEKVSLPRDVQRLWPTLFDECGVRYGCGPRCADGARDPERAEFVVGRILQSGIQRVGQHTARAAGRHVTGVSQRCRRLGPRHDE